MLRRITALVLACALSLGFAPVMREHCSRPVKKADHATEHHHGGPAEQDRADACDHCPPEDCASTAPCGGSLNSLAAVDTAVLPPADAGNSAAVAWRPAHSHLNRPPTPPPTSLL
jgi:hypothetical protein